MQLQRGSLQCHAVYNMMETKEKYLLAWNFNPAVDTPVKFQKHEKIFRTIWWSYGLVLMIRGHGGEGMVTQSGEGIDGIVDNLLHICDCPED